MVLIATPVVDQTCLHLVRSLIYRVCLDIQDCQTMRCNVDHSDCQTPAPSSYVRPPCDHYCTNEPGTYECSCAAGFLVASAPTALGSNRNYASFLCGTPAFPLHVCGS